MEVTDCYKIPALFSRKESTTAHMNSQQLWQRAQASASSNQTEVGMKSLPPLTEELMAPKWLGEEGPVSL